MGDEYKHESVLLHESLEPLIRNSGKLYVDCTLGGGGHTAYLLAQRADARVLSIDMDPDMIRKAETRFQDEISAGRLTLIHGNYSELRSHLKKYTIEAVDGILVDFGVSSFQLDQPERGFSFRKSGPLDMRMNPEAPFSAYELINEWTQKEMEKIFFEFGEERHSRKIAARIVEARQEKPFADTLILANFIASCVPRGKPNEIHPATRVFQAIRIAVNEELEGISKLLAEIPDILNPGGVFSAISFHSLEDRLVKERLKYLSADCICPPQILTCARCHHPPGRIERNKPILATEEEQKRNPRSRSAKLRIFYKNA